MENIESVIDDVNAALAVACRLRLREARQTSVVDAAEFVRLSTERRAYAARCVNAAEPF